MNCQICGTKISSGTKYCSKCGEPNHAVNKLKESSVKRNPFSLLAMFLFLFTVLIGNVLLPIFNLNVRVLTYICYLFVIMLGGMGFYQNRYYQIKKDEAGVTYGISVMVFSIFMIIAMLSKTL